MFISLDLLIAYMYEPDYVAIANQTQKVLNRAVKLKSMITMRGSPFCVEKANRLHSYAFNLHRFFSIYKIESVRTLNQIRAHFNGILINMNYLEEAGLSPVQSSLIAQLSQDVSVLKAVFDRFGITE